MSITASGLFGLTLEKMLIDTAGESLEAEDNLGILVADGYKPNFDTHDFAADLTNELSDGDYAREAVTSTELTISSGVLVFDAADQDYGAAVTLTAAMAQVLATETGGADAARMLVCLQDFVTAATSTAGQFTVQHSATGIFRIDYTP